MFRSIRVEGSFLRDWNYEASVEASGDAVVFHYICIDRGEAAAQFEELPLVKYSDDPPSRTKKVLCLRFLMQFSFLSECMSTVILWSHMTLYFRDTVSFMPKLYIGKFTWPRICHNGTIKVWQKLDVRRWWWLMFYGHFCAHGMLNGPSDLRR